MKSAAIFAVALAAVVGLGACAQEEPEERSAPRVTFSGPDYITIKHDPISDGPPPFEVVEMAERYCKAAGKSAAVTPYGRYRNSTAFTCVSEGEKVK